MRYGVVALVFSLMACQGTTAPADLDDADLVEYFPLSGHPIDPTLYPAWWAAMEACSHRTGELAALRWFTLADPHATWFWSEGHPAGGTYWPETRAIVLVPVKITNETSVKHEMLHALLGVPGHPAAFDACGVREGAFP